MILQVVVTGILGGGRWPQGMPPWCCSLAGAPKWNEAKPPGASWDVRGVWKCWKQNGVFFRNRTRWWFQIFVYFHPYLGKISNLTNIFQMGWNHHLEKIRLFLTVWLGHVNLTDCNNNKLGESAWVGILPFFAMICCVWIVLSKKNTYIYI